MLNTRIITALILAPIAIGGIFFTSPLGFALFTGAIITLGAWEWANMSGIEAQPGRVIYAAVVAALLYGLLNVPSVAVLWLAVIWWLVCFWLVRRYPAGSDSWGAVPVRAVMGLLVLFAASTLDQGGAAGVQAGAEGGGWHPLQPAHGGHVHQRTAGPAHIPSHGWIGGARLWRGDAEGDETRAGPVLHDVTQPLYPLNATRDSHVARLHGYQPILS